MLGDAQCLEPPTPKPCSVSQYQCLQLVMIRSSHAPVSSELAIILLSEGSKAGELMSSFYSSVFARSILL